MISENRLKIGRFRALTRTAKGDQIDSETIDRLICQLLAILGIIDHC